MPRYGYTVENQDVAVGSDRVQFFNGDSRRVSLILSMGSAGGLIFSDSPGSTFEDAIIITTNAGILVMPFRDWGPIIQSPIWISHTAASVQSISVTSVFLIAKCD